MQNDPWTLVLTWSLILHAWWACPREERVRVFHSAEDNDGASRKGYLMNAFLDHIFGGGTAWMRHINEANTNKLTNWYLFKHNIHKQSQRGGCISRKRHHHASAAFWHYYKKYYISSALHYPTNIIITCYIIMQRLQLIIRLLLYM